jgi:hypothetical protein
MISTDPKSGEDSHQRVPQSRNASWRDQPGWAIAITLLVGIPSLIYLRFHQLDPLATYEGKTASSGLVSVTLLQLIFVVRGYRRII